MTYHHSGGRILWHKSFIAHDGINENNSGDNRSEVTTVQWYHVEKTIEPSGVDVRNIKVLKRAEDNKDVNITMERRQWWWFMLLLEEGGRLHGKFIIEKM